MEPYKIKTVRLELPYIKLSSNQYFSMPEAYKEPGFYFVESPQGDIALVLVSGLDLCPEVWCLPNALVSCFNCDCRIRDALAGEINVLAMSPITPMSAACSTIAVYLNVAF